MVYITTQSCDAHVADFIQHGQTLWEPDSAGDHIVLQSGTAQKLNACGLFTST